MKKRTTKKTTSLTQKGLALLLAVIMTLGILPGTVFAVTVQEDIGTPPLPSESQATEGETSAPTAEAPETSAPATETPEGTTVPATEVPEEMTEPTSAPVSNPSMNTYLSVSSPVTYSSARATGSAGADGLTISKTTQPRGDGTYDLELTLKGSVGTESEQQKLDLVIVIDRSQSMNSASDHHEDRIGAAKTAANALLKTVNDNTAVDARYNIIYFSGSGHPKTTDDHIGQKKSKYVVKSNGWVNYSTATGSVDSIVLGDSVSDATNPDGKPISYGQSATNYEAAFIESVGQ